MAYTAINKSSSFMNPVLYTGNGSTQSITGVGFQPDFTWIKKRSSVESHYLYDAVRGVTKEIYSNSTAAEGTDANSLTAFGADGFSVGTSNALNENTETLASWNWKAGTTTGINTTGATITPTAYSFNDTSKMSIIKYTGNDTNNAAVPHGLGVVPNCIIVKDLSSTEHWAVVTTSMTADKMMYLNLTNAEETSQFGSTANTSVLFHLGTNAMVNSSSKDYIAYCFAEVSGFSKFGSYIGNANADGTFVYTGFKPAFVIIKGAISGDGDAAQNWELYDNKREGYNPDNDQLTPNSNAAEGSAERIDLLSNGFKIRVNSDGVNDNDSTYIYMAFGQTLVGTNNIPATAR